MEDSEFTVRKSATIIHKEEQNLVVREGMLKKRNEFRIKQARLFVLTRDGLIKYYKDTTLHRGTVVLDAAATVKRASKKGFDIITP
mmetsp:Transcript_31405/g.41599  ORF Transcript_31405/g.41599 Transcript_31405/m.41599 type:complete len:86 (+) Transcript_31405:1154-1411(+)